MTCVNVRAVTGSLVPGPPAGSAVSDHAVWPMLRIILTHSKCMPNVMTLALCAPPHWHRPQLKALKTQPGCIYELGISYTGFMDLSEPKQRFF